MNECVNSVAAEGFSTAKLKPVGMGTSGTDVGQLIAAGAAVVALGYGGIQLRENRRLASQELAYKYMERLSSLEFVPVVSAARAFWILLPGDDEQERWDQWVDMGLEEKHNVVLTMNVFEEMGSMFNRGLLDEGAVRRVMSSTVLRYWDEARWLVLRYRDNEPKALAEWETMNDALRSPAKRRFGIGEPWDFRGLWGPSADNRER